MSDADAVTKPERGEGAWPTAAVDGRFRFRREIARGGMGRVVEADDTQLGRVVAVKEALDHSDDTRMRFAREVEVTARLEHPSIVPVYDAGVSEAGDPFYVMRRVTGAPLDRLVAGAAGLDDRLVLLPNVLAVADAVAHAHGRGVIHRDLKPGNVLVGELGETVVIDWGLAKILGEEDPAAPSAPRTQQQQQQRRPLETTAGAVIGTPGYMAPEQVTAAPTDARTDVYALGACLYSVLAGRAPLAGLPEAEILARTVAGDLPPLAGAVAGVPPELVTIVEKAMAREPARRYLDAGGLGEDLRRFLAGRLVASHRYGRAQRFARWLRRHRALVTAIAIAAVLSITGGVIAIRRIVDEQRRTAAALDRERDRADDVIVAQAASLVPSDPTLAVATLATLPATSTRWPLIEPVLAGARARGVATGYPADTRMQRFDFASDPDDHRVLTSGIGAVRLIDLERRTSTTLATAAVVFAEWAGPLVVITDRDQPAPWLLDPATGARATITTPHEIRNSRAAPGVLAYADVAGGVGLLDLTGGVAAITGRAPVAVATPAAATYVWLSPTGDYLLTGGADWTQLARRTAPLAYTPIATLPYGSQTLAIAPDESRLAISSGSAAAGLLVELALPAGSERMRWTPPLTVYLAYTVDGDLYGHGMLDADVRRFFPDGTTAALAKVAQWAGPTVVAAADGVAILSGAREVTLTGREARHVLRPPLEVTSLASSPDARFVIGVNPSSLLVWDLRDAGWERTTVTSSEHLGFVAPDELMAVGPNDADSRLPIRRYRIHPTAPFAVTEHALGATIAGAPINYHEGIVGSAGVDGDLWLIRPRPPAALGAIDCAAVLDAGAIVVGTRAGAVARIDRATGDAAVLVELGERIVAIAAAAGWIVAQTATGTVWRRGPDGAVTRGFEWGTFGVVITARGDVYSSSAIAVRRWAPGARAATTVGTLPLAAVWLRRVAADRIAFELTDGSLAIYDPVTRVVAPALPPTAAAPVFADDGSRAVTVLDGGLVVVELASGERWTLVDRFALADGSLAIAPDGSSVVAGAARRQNAPAGAPSYLYRWRLPRITDPQAWIRGATNAIKPGRARDALGWSPP